MRLVAVGRRAGVCPRPDRVRIHVQLVPEMQNTVDVIAGQCTMTTCTAQELHEYNDSCIDVQLVPGVGRFRAQEGDWLYGAAVTSYFSGVLGFRDVCF